MKIAAGTRLGPYVVEAALGAGGMGEVYRGRDTKLNRDVAIKVLPELFAADPDRLVRFEREAQTLAALNHPNIAQVYGVIDDPEALAMEFIDGEDLAQRLRRGPVPIEDVVAIAKQIADALEAAHERGIIHRDLKPANVMMRPDGAVKVLDFGLAKVSEPDAHRLENSPTFTSPAITQLGMILGTAAYMAPEQAKGRTVDKRADIWAFGVMLFEMLTGKPLFAGESVAETIGAVVMRDPDWSVLPAGTPPALHELLRRCLQRDPRHRLRDIGEARILLDRPSLVPPPATVSRPARWSRLPWSLAAAAVVVGVIAVLLPLLTRAAPFDLRQLDYSVILPAEAGGAITARLSPDGRKVAVATTKGVWVQRLDDQEFRRLAEVPVVRQVFWSYDGTKVGVATPKDLSWVSVEGGALERIADISKLPGPFNPFGGDATWLRDDRILFGTGMTGVLEVSARGGQPVTHVEPASMTEDFHGAAVLPGGGVVTTVHDEQDLGTIVLLRNGRRTVVHRADGQTLGMPVYSATGHLLFSRLGPPFGIWALPFDDEAGVATGAPFLVLNGPGTPSVSADGQLLLSAISNRGASVQLAVLERGGSEVPGVPETVTVPLNLRFAWPDLSADGRTVMIALETGGASTVRIQDVKSTNVSQVTVAEPLISASWDWNGRAMLTVTGTSWCLTGDCFRIQRRNLDGGGVTELGGGWGPTVSPDGRFLVYSARTAGAARSDWNLVVLDLRAAGQPVPFQSFADWQVGARFSPAGNAVAYMSLESGRPEVYLARFPSGERIQVTQNGGSWPQWGRGGRALYFVEDTGVLEVAVDAGQTLSVGRAVEVLPPGTIASIPALSWSQGFDVNDAGTQFVAARPVAAAQPFELRILQNWLRRSR